MKSGVEQIHEEKLRDIRIMLRQGKDHGYIAGVFGWTMPYFRTFCATYGIVLDAHPAIRASKPPVPNLSVRKKVRPRGVDRSVQITFKTPPAVGGKLLEVARDRNTSVSVIADAIVSAALVKGLWPELLVSVPVASASPRNETNERQE